MHRPVITIRVKKPAPSSQITLEFVPLVPQIFTLFDFQILYAIVDKVDRFEMFPVALVFGPEFHSNKSKIATNSSNTKIHGQSSDRQTDK